MTKSLITIDGLSGSLKSTFAAQLEDDFEQVRVFHTDDFFYPPGNKKDIRSVNFDSQRFIEEVIPHLDKRDGFFIRVYDCKNKKFTRKYVKEGRINILEGSYSSTQTLDFCRSLSIILDAPYYLRHARIKKREKENYLFFKKRWFVDEIRYIKKYNPQKHSIIVRNYKELKEILCGLKLSEIKSSHLNF